MTKTHKVNGQQLNELENVLKEMNMYINNQCNEYHRILWKKSLIIGDAYMQKDYSLIRDKLQFIEYDAKLQKLWISTQRNDELICYLIDGSTASIYKNIKCKFESTNIESWQHSHIYYFFILNCDHKDIKTVFITQNYPNFMMETVIDYLPKICYATLHFHKCHGGYWDKLDREWQSVMKETLQFKIINLDIINNKNGANQIELVNKFNKTACNVNDFNISRLQCFGGWSYRQHLKLNNKLQEIMAGAHWASNTAVYPTEFQVIKKWIDNFKQKISDFVSYCCQIKENEKHLDRYLDNIDKNKKEYYKWIECKVAAVANLKNEFLSIYLIDFQKRNEIQCDINNLHQIKEELCSVQCRYENSICLSFAQICRAYSYDSIRIQNVIALQYKKLTNETEQNILNYDKLFEAILNKQEIFKSGELWEKMTYFEDKLLKMEVITNTLNNFKKDIKQKILLFTIRESQLFNTKEIDLCTQYLVGITDSLWNKISKCNIKYLKTMYDMIMIERKQNELKNIKMILQTLDDGKNIFSKTKNELFAILLDVNPNIESEINVLLTDLDRILRVESDIFALEHIYLNKNVSLMFDKYDCDNCDINSCLKELQRDHNTTKTKLDDHIMELYAMRNKIVERCCILLEMRKNDFRQKQINYLHSICIEYENVKYILEKEVRLFDKS